MQASRARILATLETKPVLVKAHVLDFTEKYCVSLASFDPSTSSWKTLQQSLLTDSALCLETFPRWGTMRDGVLYQHPMSGRTIRENAGGASALYGTQRATQTGRAALRGGSGNQWVQKKLELGKVSEEEAYVMIGQKSQVLLGTPRASMMKGICHKRGLSGEHRGYLENQVAHQEYTKLGLNTDKKQDNTTMMLPTPRTSDVRSGRLLDEQGRRVNKAGTMKYGANLSDIVIQMYPTPMAQAAGKSKKTLELVRSGTSQLTLDRAIIMPEFNNQLQTDKIGGLLNPPFVESMMGIPINYTLTKLRPVSSDLGMLKSRSVAQSRGQSLRKIWSFK